VEKRALITGATGFIGTALAAHLVGEGWEVHGLIRDDGLQVPPGLVAHEIDGTTAAVVRAVGDAAPAVAFHLASLFLPSHDSEQVAPLVSSNVLFGTQLLEAMSLAGCTRLVNTGTVWQHFGGADYEPVSLYAATKQAFEDVLAFYVSARGFSAVTLELFDTYGPNDPRPKLFSLLRRAAISSERLAMSPGEQLIDYVYIDDVTAAFLGAAERLLAGGSSSSERFEVRTGQPRRLRDVVEAYAAVTGSTIHVDWGARPYREREMMQPWAGGSELPGWTAAVDLDEGIRRMEAGSEG
jgi:nucleoside-diphosphate-sugar epimerase